MPITLPATILLDEASLVALRAALGMDVDPTRLADPGVPALGPGERELDVEFPAWQLVEERAHETYSWPQGLDEYEPFSVYEGTTSKGSIRLAIGHCERANTWGKDRLYKITFHITPGGKRPLCEFVETDRYAETGEFIAIIRGSGPTQRGMYDPHMALPGAYAPLLDKVRIYKELIEVERSWDRKAIVAHEDDFATMLNHSLIQADLRFNIRPS
jgi:hypothetical protein